MFSLRLRRNATYAFGTIVVSLAVGMAGYMGLERLDFVDAFVNAAMILSGMGPLSPMHYTAGKIFAGFYAIFSGLLIFGVAGLILAPIFHRVLHRFHLPEKDQN